jgi:hypothetical protein
MSRALTIEMKLRLLISLINDEGKERLEASLEKLVGRLVENYEQFSGLICEYLIKA